MKIREKQILVLGLILISHFERREAAAICVQDVCSPVNRDATFKCSGSGVLSFNIPRYLNSKESNAQGIEKLTIPEYKKDVHVIVSVNFPQIRDSGQYSCLENGKIVQVYNMIFYDDKQCGLLPPMPSVFNVPAGKPLPVPCKPNFHYGASPDRIKSYMGFTKADNPDAVYPQYEPNKKEWIVTNLTERSSGEYYCSVRYNGTCICGEDVFFRINVHNDIKTHAEEWSSTSVVQSTLKVTTAAPPRSTGSTVTTSVTPLSVTPDQEVAGIDTTESDVLLTVNIIKGLQSNFGRFRIIQIVLGVTLVLIAILVSAIITRCIAARRRCRRASAIREITAILAGAPEHLDRRVPFTEQADLLPYIQSYEFPRENLVLGSQIGSGAFGRVVRATATGPLFGNVHSRGSSSSSSSETTVAVKILKGTIGLSQIKLFVGELKVLALLGKHLNIVNLLGACTTDYAFNNSLMFIMEYCPYGSLQSVLRRHRSTFLDQVNHVLDTLDINNTTGVHRNVSSLMVDSGSELVIYDIPYTSQTSSFTPGEMTRPKTAGVTCRSSWSIFRQRGGVPSDQLRVSTMDLISWSFQVAKGMDYLVSKKVVHADLAARNVLLADSNVVKICDFGLSRNLHNSSYYHKSGNNPLPIRWMAPESLQSQIFSSHSDVWSFGVFMWELFSLARFPYPGMPLNLDCNLMMQTILNGYRMDKPHFSTTKIYSVMLQCWGHTPTMRPSFSELVASLDAMMEENVKSMYVELSEPYTNSIYCDVENRLYENCQ